MRYFLGVDGGQSSTLAVVADAQGQVLGRGQSGPANHIHEPGGIERCRRAVQDAVAAALAEAGLAPADGTPVTFAAACFSMSGANPTMADVIRQAVPADALVVENDYVGAHRGALLGQEGILLIAGTGSVAYGRNARGETALAGGWGYCIGDEGSAYWIGVEALRAAVRAADGRGPSTALAERLPAALGADSLAEVHRRLYAGTLERPAIARLAINVCALAEAGDAVSRHLLSAAADELALAAEAVARRLELSAPAVAIVGGLTRCSLLREALQQAIRRARPLARLLAAARPPIVGALLGAYAAASHSIAPEHIAVPDPPKG